MLDLFAGFVCLILVVFGIVFLGNKLNLLLYPKPEARMYLLVPLGREPDAELKIRAALVRAASFAYPSPCQVIALDLGMDEETRQVCQFFCGESGRLCICRADEVINIIGRDLQQV